MKTNGLAKLYGHLSPRERLPLMVAASLRGDQQECNRLAWSAPRKLFTVPDSSGLDQGVVFNALFHVIELLRAAALFWRANLMASDMASLTGDKRRNAASDSLAEASSSRADALAAMFAHDFVVQTDAWRRFCAELQIDPEAFLKDLPGYRVVELAEGPARLAALTDEEATVAGVAIPRSPRLPWNAP
jgi:hypothetical protein